MSLWNHTVLSHNFSAGRLIFSRCRTCEANHHAGVPSLLIWRWLSTFKPRSSSIFLNSASAKRRLWPSPLSTEPNSDGPCGAGQLDSPPGLRQPTRALEHPFRIVHVFEHIHAQCAVKLIRPRCEIGGRLRVQFTNLDAGSAQKPVAQSMQIEAILLAGLVAQLFAHQPAGEISQTRADFNDGVAQVRTNHACDPGQVIRRPGQIVQ